MTLQEIINSLIQLKAEIEWEYSMKYQIALDKAILLMSMVEDIANGKRPSKDLDG